MLTEDQISHFYREGYVVARSLVSINTIRKVKEAATKYAPTGGYGWQAHIFTVEDAQKDPEVHQILWEPSVIEAAQQILGTAPRFYYGMLAVVPAKGGNGLPWHQDNQYSTILGGALNIFVALTDITPERANLWVAPRSHWHGTQPCKDSDLYGKGHREASVAPENGLCLPTLYAGDTCIFDRNTYHRSLKNESDEDRYAYAAQYMAGHARMAETGEFPPNHPLARDLPNRVNPQ